MTAAAPPRGWLMQTWGEEAVAFDTASGDTHYLAPFARQLYEACRERPAVTAADLVTEFAAAYPDTPTAELRRVIDEGLATLHRIGLLHTR